MKNYKIKEMKEKRVLITGGLGFIGSNLAIKLIDLGADVTLLTKTTKKIRNIKEIKDKVQVDVLDINNKEKLRKAVKDKNTIFHFAGQTSHTYAIKNPVIDIDINCVSTLNLLEACRKYNDSAKVIFSGTVTQVGKVSREQLPITEKLRDKPIDLYSANKLAAEKYFLVYNRVYGMRTTSIRLSTIYGERQEVTNPSRGITNLFIKKAMCDERITIYGDGSFIRDYNYVGNVVDAFLLASQIEKTNGYYFNLGSNRGTKFVDMVKTVIQTVKDATGKEGRFKFVSWPKEIKKVDQGDMVIDYTKLNRFTGWYPKVSFKEGIRKTVEFYKERLNEYL